jgi:hypothetical protein
VAVVLDAIAVQVGLQLHGLADAHVAQLHLLEVGLDPHLVKRDHRHQRRAGRDALADLHRAPRHLARHGGRQLVALHREERLAHGRGGTLDVGVLLDAGAFGERAIARRLLLSGGQRRARAGQGALRGSQRGFGVVHLFAGHGTGGGERLAPCHVVVGARDLGLHARDLGFTQLDGGVERAVVGVQRTHLAHRLRQLRFGALEREPRIGRVEPHQRLADFHDVGVVDQHRQHGARDLRRDLHHRRLHVGVVGRLVVTQHQRPVRAVADGGREHDGTHRDQCGLALGRCAVAAVGRGSFRGHDGLS